MRIQVECRKRKGRAEPRSFMLGSHRLWVLRILECDRNHASQRFEVKTTDGREFALRQDLGTGEWQLGAVSAAK